jgi:hypothetical protein
MSPISVGPVRISPTPCALVVNGVLKDKEWILARVSELLERAAEVAVAGLIEKAAGVYDVAYEAKQYNAAMSARDRRTLGQARGAIGGQPGEFAENMNADELCAII